MITDAQIQINYALGATKSAGVPASYRIPANYAPQIALTNGTGANQFDLLYEEQLTLTGATQTRDLTSLTMADGSTGNMARVRLLLAWTIDPVLSHSATIDGNASNGFALPWAPFVSEVQTVTITGTPTGGTFTLTFGGQTTSAIAYNATATAVQTALQALSSIGTGNITCTGGPLPGTPVVCTFAGTLGGAPRAVMTFSGASLTGGTSPAVSVAETTLGVVGTGQSIVYPGPASHLIVHDFASVGAGVGLVTTPASRILRFNPGVNTVLLNVIIAGCSAVS